MKYLLLLLLPMSVSAGYSDYKPYEVEFVCKEGLQFAVSYTQFGVSITQVYDIYNQRIPRNKEKPLYQAQPYALPRRCKEEE